MRTVYHNGKIYTGNGLAGAFCVNDGIFEAVGDEKDILSIADAEKVDLGGRFVCPGFNDSHMHLLGFGQSLSSAQLAEHTDSLEGMLSFMRNWAEEHRPGKGGWILGRGWNQDFFRDTDRMPSREDLDGISEEFPVMLTRACGHCCVVNSRALEIAGIDGDTPSPEGGEIGRRNGGPDGRFYDNAMDLLDPFIPLPGKEDIERMILLASKELNRYGITSVQTDDYSVFRGVPFETVNSAYRELEERGLLTVRVYEQANFTGPEEFRRFLSEGNVTGKGSDMFRIGPLKLLGDGSLGSRTAHLSVPYADDPGTCGFSLFPKEELQEMISLANAYGMQIAVHAIGDECLGEVLGAYEKALEEHPREDHRHGIVHCQISRPEQLEKIADLKLHVYAQSVFLDYDNHIVVKRAGEKLASSSYSWKTLMKKGVSVSNGSDCPVELPDVMKGIECAVTRKSLDGTGPYLPGEAFTVTEALDSFTIRGAEASFEEKKKGLIAPGYLADFTVLSEDPGETEAGELHKVKILGCYLGGKKVF